MPSSAAFFSITSLAVGFFLAGTDAGATGFFAGVFFAVVLVAVFLAGAFLAVLVVLEGALAVFLAVVFLVLEDGLMSHAQFFRTMSRSRLLYLIYVTLVFPSYDTILAGGLHLPRQSGLSYGSDLYVVHPYLLILGPSFFCALPPFFVVFLVVAIVSLIPGDLFAGSEIGHDVHVSVTFRSFTHHHALFVEFNCLSAGCPRLLLPVTHDAYWIIHTRSGLLFGGGIPLGGCLGHLLRRSFHRRSLSLFKELLCGFAGLIESSHFKPASAKCEDRARFEYRVCTGPILDYRESMFGDLGHGGSRKCGEVLGDMPVYK